VVAHRGGTGRLGSGTGIGIGIGIGQLRQRQLNAFELHVQLAAKQLYGIRDAIRRFDAHCANGANLLFAGWWYLVFRQLPYGFAGWGMRNRPERSHLVLPRYESDDCPGHEQLHVRRRHVLPAVTQAGTWALAIYRRFVAGIIRAIASRTAAIASSPERP
jgi:hypothetical protein